MKNVRFYLFFAIGLATTSLKAQQHSAKLTVFQDSLIKMATATYSAIGDEAKFAENGKFVKTLVEALKEPDAYAYSFDSVKTISIVKSPDQVFRIISWYVQLENGTYRYYGTIQMNNRGTLKLFPLIDQTENLVDANVITDNKKWFGAKYYEILPLVSPGKLPYYVLLGWKGNTTLTTKKVIEVLSFDHEQVSFGAPVFDGKELKGKNRIIFEYSKDNAMTLKTDRKTGMIVYDHLAPFDPEMVNRFEFYGSDGNFDGFKILGNKLKLQEGLDLRNDPNVSDELYADPTKKVKPIRKF